MPASTYAAHAAASPALRGEPHARPRRAARRWYVARVREGREEAAARDLRALVGPDVLQDCFAPKVELLQKRRGEWTSVVRLLYPGYVFAVSGSPRALDRRLGALSLRAGLIGRQRAAYVPLSPGEQGWLEGVLDDRRVLRPSRGVIERGALRVDEGPLRGFEGRIRKVDRHKALAYVEVAMPSGPALLRAALAVVSRT